MLWIYFYFALIFETFAAAARKCLGHLGLPLFRKTSSVCGFFGRWDPLVFFSSKRCMAPSPVAWTAKRTDLNIAHKHKKHMQPEPLWTTSTVKSCSRTVVLIRYIWRKEEIGTNNLVAMFEEAGENKASRSNWSHANSRATSLLRR